MGSTINPYGLLPSMGLAMVMIHFIHQTSKPWLRNHLTNSIGLAIG